MIREADWNHALHNPAVHQLARRAYELLQQRGEAQPGSASIEWAFQILLGQQRISHAEWHAALTLVLNLWWLERLESGELTASEWPELTLGEKDWHALYNEEGSCYRSNDGTEYTRQDLLRLVFDGELAAVLLRRLSDELPETLLEEELEALGSRLWRISSSMSPADLLQAERLFSALLLTAGEWNTADLAEELLRGLLAIWSLSPSGMLRDRVRRFLTAWLVGRDKGFWLRWDIQAVQVPVIVRWALRLLKPDVIQPPVSRDEA